MTAGLALSGTILSELGLRYTPPLGSLGDAIQAAAQTWAPPPPRNPKPPHSTQPTLRGCLKTVRFGRVVGS